MEGFNKQNTRNAVAENDREWLAEAFSFLELKDKHSRTVITSADVSFMKTLFGCASISATRGNLEPETVELLIERTLPEINIFDIINFVMFARGIEANKDADYNQVSESVRKALLSDSYSDEIEDAIMKMSENEIDMLCGFILTKTETLDVSFSYPVVRRIYDARLVSPAELMAAMGFSIKSARSDGMMPGLGALLALGALGSLDD